MEIREVKLADLEPLITAAADDGHAVIRPTHVAINNGEFIGYASIGAVPLAIFFMHSKRAKALQTFRMTTFCIDLLKKNNVPIVCAPCAPTSPIHPFMPKMGFQSYGNMDMFLKTL